MSGIFSRLLHGTGYEHLPNANNYNTNFQPSHCNSNRGFNLKCCLKLHLFIFSDRTFYPTDQPEGLYSVNVCLKFSSRLRDGYIHIGYWYRLQR